MDMGYEIYRSEGKNNSFSIPPRTCGVGLHVKFLRELKSIVEFEAIAHLPVVLYDNKAAASAMLV